MTARKKHKTIGLRPILGFLIIGAAVTISAICLMDDNGAKVKAYPAGCVSQACREASDRADNSEARAREAAANAQTLEGEVERLNSEIAARIGLNLRLVYNKLSKRTSLNQKLKT